jgi:hypothetical protein
MLQLSYTLVHSGQQSGTMCHSTMSLAWWECVWEALVTISELRGADSQSRQGADGGKPEGS